MARAKKGISERAVERLEQKGYLKTVRAEMKAEAIKCLVELEEAGEIPSHLRIRRYDPIDEDNKQALSYVLEFLRFHGLTNTIECFTREVVGTIEPRVSDSKRSLLAQAVEQKANEERH
jgi:hypothetical protein